MRLEKPRIGLDVRRGVEIQLPSLFHQIDLLIELARACNSNTKYFLSGYYKILSQVYHISESP
jgi:hypothetical protein